MFAIKRTISKFCRPCVGKKVHEIESNEPSDQSDNEFFIETVNIQDSAHINQIKNENSDWSITLPMNGIPVSDKIDTGAQCNVIPLKIFKRFDPKPDLCPVNVKLSAYNNSKFLVLEKCSLTLKHKKDHFDVSFIVVVPILGLATSESLNLICRKCKRWTIFVWVFSLFWRDRNSKKYSPSWNQG